MLLITGANGSFGTELKKHFTDAIFTDYQELDITNAEQVKIFASQNKIKTIINCAAYTNTEKAEEEPEMAKKINEDGVKNLANTGAKIIHISTNFVFDGLNHLPYAEQDKTNPIQVYGQTKLNGEQYVKNGIIIRTSGLYSGNEGKNFVNSMKKLGSEKESINVVSDQIFTPTNATDLANVIKKFLEKPENFNGIYNFTNEGVCSWYDFACEIMKAFRLKCKVLPIGTANYPTKAKRPLYGVLNTSKIKKELGIEIPHWRKSFMSILQ